MAPPAVPHQQVPKLPILGFPKKGHLVARWAGQPIGMSLGPLFSKVSEFNILVTKDM